MQLNRRFFFVHVHKAAGTALVYRLRRDFESRGAIYPDASDGDLRVLFPQISIAQLLERWETRRSEIEMVAGHFPLATAELLAADFVTLTVLREPVERVLSHLRQRRRHDPALSDLPLDAIYEAMDPHLRNHMVKMFSLTADEVADSVPRKIWPMFLPIDLTEERLIRAEAEIARVDVLGFQEHFDDFCDELQARFGWDMGEPVYANRSIKEETADALRARIAADNALDVEFFEFARDLYERRGNA